MENEYAILLFNVSENAQVFHIVKESELNNVPHPYHVFWQDLRSRIVYGPFVNIQSAMHHYGTRKRTEMRIMNYVPTPEGKVIEVDFALKRRL